MRKKLNVIFLLLLLIVFSRFSIEARLPQLTPKLVNAKLHEIMKSHATYKELTPELIKRTLQNYLEEIDPNKTYFLESDIDHWLHPNDAMVQRVLVDYTQSNFSVFQNIYDEMVKAIERRRLLEKKIDMEKLPKHVSIKEFKDLKWAKSELELINRWEKIKALQLESSIKINPEVKDLVLQRITKRQLKYEDQYLTPDPVQREKLMLSNVIKATAAALDSHTAYFTPDEASQFMISVQQRLFGIGAQLRDDISGFTVVKIVDGSPAAIGKELKVKDRIIAVNGEPVVGMDIEEAVELIRGEKETPVKLTVVREVKDGERTHETTLDVVVLRGEVVLKESRYESSYEPFGDGIIGYIRLHTFYQDPESSSAQDLAREIQKLKTGHRLLGLIFDLRYNSGGLLSQAVEVAGLFISKGIVVSVKDNSGNIQHLRDLDEKVAWDGPLIILTNRASASAAEIVAQTLQDYGRAIIVGDDHTFGKGTFQTFTLNTTREKAINTEGEYKVTRGKYYTVSGKTPQLTGVISNIEIPGSLSEMEIGEKFSKYPLENDQISPNFDDDLADLPFAQREKIRLLYKFDLQPKLNTYVPYMETLRTNALYRMAHNKNYQSFLKELKKEDEVGEPEEFGQNDLQLTEAFNIMKDLIVLKQ